jgi:hypothetical protein
VSKAALLIEELRGRGVELIPNGLVGVGYRAPQGAITPELRGALAIHRDAVAELLQVEAKYEVLYRGMEELAAAAAANEALGAMETSERQYTELGDLIERSFPLEERLRALVGDRWKEFRSCRPVPAQPELVGVR